MTRKKPTPKNQQKNDIVGGEFIYCANFKCPIYDCMRHHLKQPWNVVIRTKNWSPDKNGKCNAYYTNKIQSGGYYNGRI